MKTVRTVFLKEIVDNFRDRRTLMSALLMGPLFGPILFAFIINLSVKQSLDRAEEPLDLPVIGRENAPNLVTFLESQNIIIAEGPASRDAVRVCLVTVDCQNTFCIPGFELFVGGRSGRGAVAFQSRTTSPTEPRSASRSRMTFWAARQRLRSVTVRTKASSSPMVWPRNWARVPLMSW